jgi:hypothetical protein
MQSLTVKSDLGYGKSIFVISLTTFDHQVLASYFLSIHTVLGFCSSLFLSISSNQSTLSLTNNLSIIFFTVLLANTHFLSIQLLSIGQISIVQSFLLTFFDFG